MTTDQTDHRAEADGWLANMLNATTMRNEKQAHRWVTAHLLAALHDGQQEQTALLRALVEQATPKGDPCPCGCRRDVEPKPHVHFWKRQQNVTSHGYAMDPIEVCDCGTARRATDPEPESVTVTLPERILGRPWTVVELRTLAEWADNAGSGEAGAVLGHVADALDAANGSRS